MMNGIYTDVSISEYHQNKTHISATSIKYIKKSLALWRWMQTNPQEEKLHLAFGNAFEIALLDKNNFEKFVAIMQTENWVAKALEEKPKLKVPKSSKCYQAEEEKFIKENEGKYILPDVGAQSFEYIAYMLEACHKDAVIQKLIKNTEYQVSLFWTDDQTGVNLKTRPDICKRKKNVIVNLKTSVDGSPSAFSKDLAKYDYALQAAMEIRGCIESELMSGVDNYFWLVVEKEPPFNATLYEFDNGDQAYSQDELDFLLSKIKKAKEENLYPGYGDRSDNPYGILTAVIPTWYKTIYS